VVKVPHYILLQHEQDSGFIHPYSIQLLQNFREKVLEKSQLKSFSSSPYIYISRKKTENRSLYNEQELEDALQDLGFSILYSEELFCEQQIVTFSRASCIVASHGAGLSHMIWAEGKVNVLEIFAFGHFNDCYARVAMSLGFAHDYLHCQEKEDTYGEIIISEVLEKIKKFDVSKIDLPEQVENMPNPGQTTRLGADFRKEPPVAS
jgi:capsular polysaccharide biosynthesis protein